MKSSLFSARCKLLENNQLSFLSGRRDSNPRPSAWEANALPTELLPQRGMSFQGGLIALSAFSATFSDSLRFLSDTSLLSLCYLIFQTSKASKIALYHDKISPSSKPPRTPTAVPVPSQSDAYASYPPSASPTAYAYARYHRHNTLP